MLKLFDKWKGALNYKEDEAAIMSVSSGRSSTSTTTTTTTSTDSSVSDDSDEALQRFLDNSPPHPHYLKQQTPPPPILYDPKLKNKKDQFIFSPSYDYSSLFPSSLLTNDDEYNGRFKEQEQQEEEQHEQQKQHEQEKEEQQEEEQEKEKEEQQEKEDDTSTIIEELHNSCKKGKITMVKSLFEEETIALLNSDSGDGDDIGVQNLACSTRNGKLLLEVCTPNPLLITLLLKRGAPIPQTIKEDRKQILMFCSSLLERTKNDKTLKSVHKRCLYLHRIKCSNGLSRLQKNNYSIYLKKASALPPFPSIFPTKPFLSMNLLRDSIGICCVFDCVSLLQYIFDKYNVVLPFSDENSNNIDRLPPPLHLAAMMNSAESVEFLLSHSVHSPSFNPAEEPFLSKTAFEWATNPIKQIFKKSSKKKTAVDDDDKKDDDHNVRSSNFYDEPLGKKGKIGREERKLLQTIAIIDSLEQQDGHEERRSVLKRHDAYWRDVKTGRTMLHRAVQRNDLVSLRILLEKEHSLLFVADDLGMLALHVAAERGNIDSLKELLKWDIKGLSVNCECKNGMTALHIAAEMMFYSCCSELVAAGAAKDSRNADGMMAVDLVPKEEGHQLVDLLRSAGPRELSSKEPLLLLYNSTARRDYKLGGGNGSDVLIGKYFLRIQILTLLENAEIDAVDFEEFKKKVGSVQSDVPFDSLVGIPFLKTKMSLLWEDLRKSGDVGFVEKRKVLALLKGIGVDITEIPEIIFDVNRLVGDGVGGVVSGNYNDDMSDFSDDFE